MSRFLWPAINLLQAMFLALWSAFWILAALAVRGWSGGAGLPLAMARRCWAPGLLLAGGIRVEVKGLERVDFSRPHLFVANHRSIVDVLVLYRALPAPLLFVVKEELRRMPFLGWYIAAMGMIFIPRHQRRRSLENLRQCRRRFAGGSSILMFPEGTRGRGEGVRPFRSGGFVAAIDSGVPVVPVALAGTGEILPPGGFRLRPGTARVTLGEPIPTAGLAPEDRRSLAEEARERVVALK